MQEMRIYLLNNTKPYREGDEEYSGAWFNCPVDFEEIREKIKELLIDSLGIEAEVLTDDVPLFGDGIGLDSIDSLEMIAAIDKEFGVSMTGVGKEPFYNVASLAKYVAEHK
jgi:acyl carrier protein